MRVLGPILSPNLPIKAPPRKAKREQSACRSEIRKLVSRGVSHNRATARASCIQCERSMRTRTRDENVQGNNAIRRMEGICAHLSRVPGLESTPDEDGRECDDVPRLCFFFFNRNGVLSTQVKFGDGHVTGQETPSSQGPCGLRSVDVFPKITSLSEVTGPPVAFVFHRIPGVDFWGSVSATQRCRGIVRNV